MLNKKNPSDSCKHPTSAESMVDGWKVVARARKEVTRRREAQEDISRGKSVTLGFKVQALVLNLKQALLSKTLQRN